MKNKYIKLFIALLITLGVLATLFFLYELITNRDKFFENTVGISEVSSLDYQEGMIRLKIKPNNRQYMCAISSKQTDVSNLKFSKLEDGYCYASAKEGENYVYFKSYFGLISEPLLVTDYVYDVAIKDIYYLPIDGTINFNKLIGISGNKEYEFVYDDDIFEIDGNVLKALKDGNTSLKIYYKDELVKETKIYVTSGITTMPKEFDYKKKHLSCGQYSEEDARLMDEILAYRISEAGYGTRAGVVAAGRFLTLEFPYRIAYFYENGRVHESSPHYCDGEGRYYHVGLYLHKYKYSEIVSRVSGPAIWGCNLINYEPDPPLYVPNTRMPNGLDCSGFVSWAILNGGFDVGDIGAGESAYKHQMTDQGEYTPLTQELINSGKIRVGDLFNYSGHIALLIGEDKDHYYIAESLPTFNGLVAKTYEKSKVNKVFTHVVLMDVFYKEDGNLTDMW